MSNLPENNLDLDQLFLPVWAQQSPSVNQYADYKGGGDSDDGGRSRGRDFRPGGNRDRGFRRRDPQGGPAAGSGEGRFDRGRRDRPGSGPDRGPMRPAPAPERLPEIDVMLVPEGKGVEAIARQIRLSGRAYPLFDIGFLVLKKPERYTVTFKVIKKADGQVAQPLFLCSLDQTLWLAEQEAMDHILHRHFAMFYQEERIPTEGPKGKFTFVAQCGMSGIILGPPNFHDYQNKLHRLHAERFAHLPFEVYKSRVRIVSDEAVVKKWIEDQSFATEYLCLNVPEPKKLSNREEVERHFLETHLPNVIQSVTTATISGPASRTLPCRPLQALVRHAFDEQHRFPLKVVTTLSQQFASHGLQFFKVNKTLTHVSVARPRFLDLNTTSVSENVKRIMGYIDANPKANRKKLVETLVPAQAAPAPAPAPESAVAATPASEAGAAPAINEPPQNPEVAAIISDLHWLIHEGHVIEFANGILETAKAPAPRPPKPPKPEVKSTRAENDPAPTSGEETKAPDTVETATTAAEETKPDAEIPAAAISPTPTETLPESPSMDPIPPVAGA